jgi:hypothetical protein
MRTRTYFIQWLDSTGRVHRRDLARKARYLVANRSDSPAAICESPRAYAWAYDRAERSICQARTAARGLKLVAQDCANPCVRSIIVPTIVPAVPVPIIVNKTCSGINRRPPEGTPPVPTDYAPDNQADRPGEHQAGAGTENCADVISVRSSRTKGDHQNRRCSQ